MEMILAALVCFIGFVCTILTMGTLNPHDEDYLEQFNYIED